MTEEDTFKRLKGLTLDEAELLEVEFHQAGMDSPDTVTIGDVCRYVNERLKPYGWTTELIELRRNEQYNN